jgi:hypothetical protein
MSSSFSFPGEYLGPHLAQLMAERMVGKPIMVLGKRIGTVVAARVEGTRIICEMDMEEES